jgi:hypothetical protein
MENIKKKPYEISLWEDVLFWHRRKLAPITFDNGAGYETGKYYSKNIALGGEDNKSAIPYTLDYEPWSKDKIYYELMP